MKFQLGIMGVYNYMVDSKIRTRDIALLSDLILSLIPGVVPKLVRMTCGCDQGSSLIVNVTSYNETLT